jgi:RNA polymerase sigma-70 factor (ECF subfamily)
MNRVATDAEVVSRVLAGDVEAFGVLVDRYQDEFAGYAKYMTGSADEAADIIQESLVRAYRALRRCRDPDNFKGWLFRIVSNQCKTHLARRQRRGEEGGEGERREPAAADDPHGDLEMADLRRRLHDALQALPLDQREALVLKYVEGLSLEEMAERLSASVSALKMRLLRGRASLRAKLEGVLV